MQFQNFLINWKAFVVVMCFCLPMSVKAGPTATVDSFHVAATFTSKGGMVNGQTVASNTIAYRLYVPKNYNPAVRYPIMLSLHGAGEAGSDNRIQLTAYRFTSMWADDTLQAKQPMFVLVPQCPGPAYTVTWTPFSYNTGSWRYANQVTGAPLQAVVELYDSLVNAYSIDTTRQYVSGLSMGGYSTWYLLSRFPNRWAAAVPVCGSGDSSRNIVNSFLNTPIWDFHGANDPSINVRGSREMLASLRAAYAVAGKDTTGVLRYTEYPGVGHNSWVNASNDPRLMPWVIAQRRTPTVTGIINPRNTSKRISWQSLSGIKLIDVLGRRSTEFPNLKPQILDLKGTPATSH